MYLFSNSIKLNNIKFEAIHGLYDIEKINKQLFEVDVEIHLFQKKSCNDNIKNSIDYENVYNLLLDTFTNNILQSVVLAKMYNNYFTFSLKVGKFFCAFFVKEHCCTIMRTLHVPCLMYNSPTF